MTSACDYCGREIDGAATFTVTVRAGDGELANHLCSENCLVAYAVGSPVVGRGGR